MPPEKIGDKLKSRIEKGVPLPMKKGVRVNEFHEVLETMKVTDSILCEDQEILRCQFVINTVHRAKTGRRYLGRRLGQTKKRFWRME